VRSERDIKNRVVLRVFFVFLDLFVQCFTTVHEWGSVELYVIEYQDLGFLG
jgi:hypothetical protein